MQIPEKFPHMRKPEIEILKRYLLNKAPEGRLTIDYRYPIEPSLVPSFALESEKTMWIALNQKRSEAVIEAPEGVYIIEVKERVNSLALGQLLNYRDLYTRLVNPSARVFLVCVAEADDAQISPSLMGQGIQIVLV